MKTYKDILKEQKNKLGSSPSLSTGGFRSQDQFRSASGKTLTGLDNQLALSGNLGTSYGQGVLTTTSFTDIGLANQKKFINTNKPGTKKGGVDVDLSGGKDTRGDTDTRGKDNTDTNGNSPIYGEPLTSIQTGDGGQVYFYENGMVGYDFDGDGTVDFWDPRFFGKDFTGEFNYDMLLELLSYYSRLATIASGGGETETPPGPQPPIGTTPDPQPPIGTTPDQPILDTEVETEVEDEPDDETTEEDIDRAGEFYDPVSNTLVNLSYNPAQVKAYYRELYAFDGNGDGIPDWLVDGYKSTVESYGIYAIFYGLAPDLVYDDAGNLTLESLQSIAALLALSGFNNPLMPDYQSVFAEGSAFYNYFFGPGGIYEGRYEEFFGNTGDGDVLPDDYFAGEFADSEFIDNFFADPLWERLVDGSVFQVGYTVDDLGNYIVQFEYTIQYPDTIGGQPGPTRTFTNLYGIDYAPQDGIIDEVFFENTGQDTRLPVGIGTQFGTQLG